MVDELDTRSPNFVRERSAVARLIRECGNAVSMDYGCRSSGAQSSRVERAFENFGYHENADYQRRFWYSTSTWTSRIRSDLDRGRPVYYRGRHDKGGHAFVCDGYTDNNFFHFNWGWNGLADGWFTLNNLNPHNNYNSHQAAIFYLRPASHTDYCNFSLPLQVHYTLSYILPNSTPPHLNVPQTFRVLESVPAASHIPTSWHTIEAGQTAVYTAHEEIILHPGFHAKAGSTFIARIEPCRNCGLSGAAATLQMPEQSISTPFRAQRADIEFETTEMITQSPIFYPNPTRGIVYIDTKSENLLQTISVFCVNGQRLLHFDNVNATREEIDLSGFPSGIYIITLNVGGKNYSNKIILQK